MDTVRDSGLAESHAAPAAVIDVALDDLQGGQARADPALGRLAGLPRLLLPSDQFGDDSVTGDSTDSRPMGGQGEGRC